MSFSSLRLSFLFICFLTFQALPTFAQISTVNGNLQYSGTPVLDNPIGVPTLVYNCAKVPSLCKNVNGNGGNYALSDLGNNLNGDLVNGVLTLHVDPDSDRGDDRRTESCPSSWKRNHVCPEPNQPLVVPEPFNKGGRTVSSGFVGYALNAAAFDYHILDPSGGFTGMAWTCDEFPPAFSIEGGQTGGSSANTYCAPQFSKDCNGLYTRTEQDFQSSAHGRLQTKEVAAGGQAANIYATNIWTFRFKTEFVNDDNAFATRVDYYIDPNGESGALYGIDELEQKRSDRKILVSHRVHGNGSISEKYRYVDFDHGMSNGTQLTEDPFAEIGAVIRTRYLVEPTPTNASVAAEPEKRTACVLPAPSPITDEPDEAAPIPVTATFATYSCTVGQVATTVGYN